MADEEGPVCTRGRTYRARAEARQRAYRAIVLGTPHGAYGHMLSQAGADEGRNFVLPEAFEAARARRLAGKGVAERTFENMLSSQAMCFNLFAPLAHRRVLATEVLRPFIPGMVEVTAIHLEYTPAGDVFGDQAGRGGVDCDVLIEGRTDRGTLLQVIETKFVEPAFSTCGFRDAGRASKGQAVCPDDVPVRADRTACLYARKKGYAYWKRTDEHALLAPDALAARGCPFGGQAWQLWVNLALAHEEAARRGATDVRLAVCASPRNTALLGAGEALARFAALLRDPGAVSLLDLEALIVRIAETAPPALSAWATGLTARYGSI
jgi:hypothetical protein